MWKAGLARNWRNSLVNGLLHRCIHLASRKAFIAETEQTLGLPSWPDIGSLPVILNSEDPPFPFANAVSGRRVICRDTLKGRFDGTEMLCAACRGRTGLPRRKASSMFVVVRADTESAVSEYLLQLDAGQGLREAISECRLSCERYQEKKETRVFLSRSAHNMLSRLRAGNEY